MNSLNPKIIMIAMVHGGGSQLLLLRLLASWNDQQKQSMNG
jgi:hypothetical protein